MSADPVVELSSILPGLGRSVLLVDDDRLQAKLLRAQLEASGFVVNLANSAAEALDALARDRTDAVLSDVMMDETDGFTLCQALRSDPNLAGLPIVLVSSYFNDETDKELAQEVGADALVPRTPSCQPAVEALVRSLAEPKADVRPEKTTSERHLRCVSNQLSRFRKETFRAETRYRAVFEHANDALCILTMDGVVVEVNQRWEEIMQRPREELLGLHVRDFTAPEHQAANVRRFNLAASREASKDQMVPVRRKDGSTVYLDFTTSRVELDGCERILAIGRDVTEVVESERRLAATEHRYQALVENIPEVLWSATASSLRIEFVSSNVANVFGFTDREVLQGQIGTLYSRVHPDDAGYVRTVFAEAARDRAPVDVEYRWRHLDGRWIWIHCRASLARGLDGVERFDGVLSDVSGRKALEEQLCQSQKIEALGQLTAGLAHDFRNILAVVGANADYLLDRLSPGETREVAGEIREASRRGVDLTSRLMAFARREAAVPREVTLNAIVEGVRPMLARAVGSAVSLRFVPCEDPWLTRLDAREIEQVLMNLAVNARDAMSKGGTLSIETANVEVMLPSTRKGHPPIGRYVSVSVRDTGCGMDAATLEHMFEPFYTTKEAGRGTGLGLSTSYGTVRRYGGTISVKSTPGVGTTFTIYFPRVGTTQAPPPAN